MKFMYYVLLGFLILGFMNGTLAATVKSEVAATPELKNEERGGSARTLNTDGTSEMWLINNSWTIAAGTLAAIILVGGAAAVFYYFYYINYYGYSGEPYAAYQYNQQYSNGQYYAPNSRSFDAAGSSAKWNISWGQILYMISLAQESYEQFDYQSMDCQKKILCELTQKKGAWTVHAEQAEKNSENFRYQALLPELPMPETFENYLKAYSEAINQGQNSAKDCSTVYSNCGFSVRDILDKYRKRAEATGKF